MTHIVVIPCPRTRPRAFGSISGAAIRFGLAARRAVTPAARRLEYLPAWSWPLLAAVAGWPGLAWSLRRFGDGSDDPFGIVAWIALAFALLTARRRFDHPPRTGLLATAAATALAASLPIAVVPDLLRALLATIAIVLALAAIVDDDEPFLPYAGFAILALPLLSSFQFYAGYPLRVVTAEASRWLLEALGSSVARNGSALVVDGRLVLVDAPCSGVKMAWVGYFTACFSAWLFRTSNATLARRLPLVGLTILVCNIARNTVLVALEAGDAAVSPSLHEGIGLFAIGIACLVIVALFAVCGDRVRALQRIRIDPCGRFSAPPLGRAALVSIASAFSLAAALPLFAKPSLSRPTSTIVEWPTRLDGEPLIPVALSAVERRFVGDFPGSIARFTQKAKVVVLREVERPTRRLHPAADCYRALGYAIVAERLERREHDLLWRCFDARRQGKGLRVCERIVDSDGQAFTDVSSWYWWAVLGHSHGPWRAATIAVPVDLVSAS